MHPWARYIPWAAEKSGKVAATALSTDVPPLESVYRDHCAFLSGLGFVCVRLNWGHLPSAALPRCPLQFPFEGGGPDLVNAVFLMLEAPLQTSRVQSSPRGLAAPPFRVISVFAYCGLP